MEKRNEFVEDDFLKLNFKRITVSKLVSFLKINPNITKLSVQGCVINDEEVEALANLKNLTQLNFDGNKISDEGVEALMNLKKSTSLNLHCHEVKMQEIKNLFSGSKQSGSSIEIFDPAKSENKTTLDEIIIPESLRKELNKILDIIPEKNKALLQKTGYKPEKGYLFYGPPGNGKTKIARAVACQANMKFISISASEFQKSYVGQGEALVRELFKKARANAPCIVFIDEIDCIATERGNGSSSYAKSCSSLVNQFLTELDGFNPLEGVTVIAATNRKDVLDKAFIRPGRLSNHIEIPLPDKTQREEILNLYIKKFKDTEELEVTVDINKLADKTDGFSGAELEYLINQTAWDIICRASIEGKVTLNNSHFIKSINDLKKKKPQEPEGKKANGGLELLNSPKPNCSSDIHIDNVESHSSANSNSDVVVTLQQWVKTTTKTSEHIQTQINDLKEEYDEKFEELNSKNSDLKQGLRQDLTKTTTQCTEKYTQLAGNLEAITERYTQLQSELESMVTTELKKHESTLENRVEDLQEQFEGKNKELNSKYESTSKELNSKYEKFLGASINSKRQGSYASISFVLSGASAVGASLTMFHLAMCLSFAVAALIFLAAGCYCLYKANTTLSNVEIDQNSNYTEFLTA